jgi:hypothetical protein
MMPKPDLAGIAAKNNTIELKENYRNSTQRGYSRLLM